VAPEVRAGIAQAMALLVCSDEGSFLFLSEDLLSQLSAKAAQTSIPRCM
jgi:hypothetical protein